MDVIGEPGLSTPARPPLTSDAYASWLDGVLRGLTVDRASIVGASLGGWLALYYAIRRPARVDRLVLLGPGGIGRQKWGVVLAATGPGRCGMGKGSRVQRALRCRAHVRPAIARRPVPRSTRLTGSGTEASYAMLSIV